VLADRKGYFICRIKNRAETVKDWIINLDPLAFEHDHKYFRADTYPAAEQAARAYLLALPDREAK
jgi:hypothetical protein